MVAPPKSARFSFFHLLLFIACVSFLGTTASAIAEQYHYVRGAAFLLEPPDPAATRRNLAELSSIIAREWQIVLAVVLSFLSSLSSGLTLGLMTLDVVQLEVLAEGAASADPKLQRQAAMARRVLSVRRDGNLVLVSLLLLNVSVNSAFSILTSELTSGLVGLLVSTSVITLFGEILPQAVCAKFGLQAGYYLYPAVVTAECLLYVIAKPTALLLDKLLGRDIGTAYSREQLKALVEHHERYLKVLRHEEMQIVSGGFDVGKKRVGDAMTPLSAVFGVEVTSVLNFDTAADVILSGYSRVPVFDWDRPDCIVGVFHAKDIALIDPNEGTPLSSVMSLYGRCTYAVDIDMSLLDLLREFKTGRSHLAVVREAVPGGEGRDPHYRHVGIITLEDVLEEILQDEIYDEYEQQKAPARSASRVSSTHRNGNNIDIHGSRPVSLVSGVPGSETRGRRRCAAAAGAKASLEFCGSVAATRGAAEQVPKFNVAVTPLLSEVTGPDATGPDATSPDDATGPDAATGRDAATGPDASVARAAAELIPPVTVTEASAGADEAQPALQVAAPFPIASDEPAKASFKLQIPQKTHLDPSALSDGIRSAAGSWQAESNFSDLRSECPTSSRVGDSVHKKRSGARDSAAAAGRLKLLNRRQGNAFSLNSNETQAVSMFLAHALRALQAPYLTPSNLIALLHEAHVLSPPPKTPVFERGEPCGHLLLVLQGRIKLSIGQSEAIECLLGPWTVLGSPALGPVNIDDLALPPSAQTPETAEEFVASFLRKKLAAMPFTPEYSAYTVADGRPGYSQNRGSSSNYSPSRLLLITRQSYIRAASSSIASHLLDQLARSSAATTAAPPGRKRSFSSEVGMNASTAAAAAAARVG